MRRLRCGAFPIALLLIGFAGVVGCTSVEKPDPGGLSPWMGKDLRKLDEADARRFRRQHEALTGDGPPTKEDSQLNPWWAQPFGSGECAWMLLNAYPSEDIPDASAAEVELFDGDWPGKV